jgi:hypothetical protein
MSGSERISRADHERIKQENIRLQAENRAMRPLISQLGHDLALTKRKLKELEQDGSESHG